MFSFKKQPGKNVNVWHVEMHNIPLPWGAHSSFAAAMDHAQEFALMNGTIERIR